MKLPKIPINHKNMQQECFSGKRFLLHDKLGGIVSGSYKPSADSHVWRDDVGFTYRLHNFTHYTTMPEFYEEGGE